MYLFSFSSCFVKFWKKLFSFQDGCFKFSPIFTTPTGVLNQAPIIPRGMNLSDRSMKNIQILEFIHRFIPSMVSPLYSLLPWGFSICPHYAERHEPLGQVNEKYTSIGIYTSIYTITRESTTSRHHDIVSFPHNSIIILLKIHVKCINILYLQ